MYNATKWLDKVVDAETSEVIQEGTDQSAGHFNNMERGITDAHMAERLLTIMARQTADQVETEVQTVTLTNTAKWPTNNSLKSVALTTARNYTDYTVEAEVLEHTGNVGEIHITNRLLNGFKVSFDGSATSATVKLRIKGGM